MPFSAGNVLGSGNYAGPTVSNCYFINLGTGGTVLGGYYTGATIKLHSSGNNTDQLVPKTTSSTSMGIRMEGTYSTVSV